MPELPEVQRATNALKERCCGETITKVEVTEDRIVFADGITHEDFASELTGRKVLDVKRYGKVFYFNLDGEGRSPVLHFGMTGNIHIKGSNPLKYMEGPKKQDAEWPPRFMKFILHLSSDGGKTVDTEVAFIDPRRLARIRLCNKPTEEPPISALGFDPILCMPSLEEFSTQVLKRSCPIKALLLDQSFSAGVGNWVADEILYHARVHPEQRCNTLNEEQVKKLYEKMKYVCETAVSVNAESNKFPTHWLFGHRWGKGKRKEQASKLLLESGDAATIKWITVGGRTSAYVVELQKNGGGTSAKRGPRVKQEVIEESTTIVEQSTETTISRTTRSKRKVEESSSVQPTRQKRKKT
ncbi:AtMMH-1 [Schizopora paradoxa]|uniref:AtMMH-1 n=1 Tax=Schizopora paradoxa TaxID=27342 RepID=A0A0H2R2Y5_9AGAM|nr:AtMMH-1 [Schizopora paradoxa]